MIKAEIYLKMCFTEMLRKQEKYVKQRQIRHEVIVMFKNNPTK